MNRYRLLCTTCLSIPAAAVVIAAFPLVAGADTYTQTPLYSVTTTGSIQSVVDDDGYLVYLTYSGGFKGFLATPANNASPASLSFYSGFPGPSVTDGSATVGTTSGANYWSGSTGTISSTSLPYPTGTAFPGGTTSLTKSGNQIGGYASNSTTGGNEPVIWNFSSGAYTPTVLPALGAFPVGSSNTTYSYNVSATDGAEQAGVANDVNTGTSFTGVYWNSLGTAVNLGSDPAGIGATVTGLTINGVSGTTVVGSETISGGGQQAIKISVNGNTSSASALTNSLGSTFSSALATNGTDSVGFVFGTNGYVPLLWSSDGTAIELPMDGFTSAQATSIDADGDVFGWGENGSTLSAVEWVVAAPEPSALGLLAIGGLVALRRSRCSSTRPA